MGVCERIKDEVSITDYARYMGFTILKKGSYYTLKEHDSVMISLKRKKYWQNSNPSGGRALGTGGSVIDFAMNFGGYSRDEAIRELIRFGNIRYDNEPMIKQTRELRKTENINIELNLPEASDSVRNVFAYLIKTRAIAKEVVTELMKRQMIYQDIHKNCVFVGYDIDNMDKVVYACLRGTNTYKQFRGDVQGCDYSKGIYVQNGSEKLVVAEAFIDAMSIMTINGKDWKKYDYIALGGTGKYEAIKTYLDKGKTKKLLIATDNDKGGINAAEIIRDFFPKNYPDVLVKFCLPPTSGRDWNELLKECSHEKLNQFKQLFE